MFSFWDSGLGMIVICLIFVFVAIGMIASIVGIANHLNFPVDLARVEQLRKDAQDIDIRGSEGIYAMVCKYNQKIAINQKWNSMWWADWFISDRWNDVESIQLPKVKKGE